MSERWVLGTVVEKQGDGTYRVTGAKCFNIPALLTMNKYVTSDGVEYTHIENEYLDVYLQEPIEHFLPDDEPTTP